MDNQNPETGKIIKPRHRKPSLKQIKYTQFRSMGYSKAKSMRMAGYSISTSKGSKFMQNIDKSKGVLQVVDDVKDALKNSKLTGQFIADKFEEWLNAKKDSKSDYKVQIEAFRQFREITKPTQQEVSRVKRKVTFEEFIGENENKLQ